MTNFIKISNGSASFLNEGRFLSIDSSDHRFPNVIKLLREEKVAEAAAAMSGVNFHEALAASANSIEGLVFDLEKGTLVHAIYGDMTDLVQDGLMRLTQSWGSDRVTRFLERLFAANEPTKMVDRFQLAESKAALIQFMNQESLFLDEEGFCVGMKAVGHEMLGDLFNGRRDQQNSKIYYNIGEWVEEIDFSYSRNSACGSGLHIGTLPYAYSWGGDPKTSKIILCKFDPKDIVSVASEASFKIRVRRLFVISEMVWDMEMSQKYFNGYQEVDVFDYDYDDWDDSYGVEEDYDDEDPIAEYEEVGYDLSADCTCEDFPWAVCSYHG